MAFSEFCDQILRSEAPQRFEGGNVKQRNKLNVGVKAWENLRDACARFGADDGANGLPTATFNGWICVNGESQYYTIAGQPATPPS